MDSPRINAMTAIPTESTFELATIDRPLVT